jgi:hypothetical protein
MYTALELGSRFEGAGVEEGDGIELSMPLDDAGAPAIRWITRGGRRVRNASR